MSIRDAIGQTILDQAKTNPNIVVLSADLTDSLRVGEFKKVFPERFFAMGVAEQNMAGVAAGLALVDKIPFIMSFAVFNPGLNLSMIRTIAYSNLNVKIVGGHAGLSNHGDGATHQALEDIAIMRTMPNMTVLVPSDGAEAEAITKQAIKIKGPVYIRSTRLNTSTLKHVQKFKLGQPEIIYSHKLTNPQTDKPTTLIATGVMVATAIKVAKQLKDMSTQVINLATIKPIDVRVIQPFFTQSSLVISIEDHQATGGLGGLLAETATEMTIPHAPLLRIGIQDKFGQSAKTPETLYQAYGLDVTSIVEKIKANR